MSPSRRLQKLALAASVLLACSVTPLAAHADAPMQKTQAPGWYRTMVGAFEVTALSDGTTDLPVDKLLHAPPKAVESNLHKHYLSTPVETSFNAYLVNTGTKLVLIDTGAGNLFGPNLGRLAAQIVAAGYSPEQVDDIFITHMHPDHVGGLAPQGKPAFPNATVHVDQADRDFWMSKANMDAAPAESKGFFQGAQAAFGAYESIGKVKTFQSDGEVIPGIRTMATHGHTPGHAIYAIESQGKRLVVIGDLIHVAAVQLESPQVTIHFDSDAKQAREQRMKTFNQLAKDGSLVAAAHFPFPGLGRLRTSGNGFAWEALNYSSQVK